jgi:hypothetical protein
MFILGVRERTSSRRSFQSNLRNSSAVSPASCTIPPIVKAWIGLCRGIVTWRVPSLITICLPWRMIVNPAFSRARTAFR